jgi:hypothetical protein
MGDASAEHNELIASIRGLSGEELLDALGRALGPPEPT